MAVYVKIPAPLPIFDRVVNPETLETEPRKVRSMTFFDVIDWLTNDQYFGKSAKLGKVAAELLAEFEGKAAGQIVKLTSEQHDHIKKVLEAPTSPFLAIVNKQIVPLLDALTEPMSEDQFKKEHANGRSDAGQPAHA
jgi:hypothetical protein